MPLLLCDLDDTVVSRRTIFERWAAAYLAEVGAPEHDVAWFVEIDDDGLAARPQFFELIISRYGLTESVEAFAKRYHRDYISSFRCEPWVVAALGEARAAGFKIAIVTNGDVRTQGAKIEAAGIAGLVDACCIAEGVGHWKPAREVFEFAAAKCGESLEGAWMIGDNPVADIGGARACGARTVWMRKGDWPVFLDYRPDHAVDTFPDGVGLVLTSGV